MNFDRERTMIPQSLFEKYGGITQVSALVHAFYEDVLEEAQLSGYFKGVDMDTLIDHQVKFFSQVLGGPTQYAGRDLRIAHAGLSITTEDFALLGKILAENLADAGLEEDDVQAVLSQISALHSDIVSFP